MYILISNTVQKAAVQTHTRTGTHTLGLKQLPRNQIKMRLDLSFFSVTFFFPRDPFSCVGATERKSRRREEGREGGVLSALHHDRLGGAARPSQVQTRSS